MINADDVVEYNGVTMKIREIPSQTTRAMFGFGHHMPTAKMEGRVVIQVPGRTCEYKPEECPRADETQGEWVSLGPRDEDQYLVCRGCGLDGT